MSEMMSRRLIQQENTEFQILRHLEINPDITQRELSDKVNISLGSVNYALNALIARGWVKFKNFHKSEQKVAYAYMLTPEGLSQKAMLAKRFWVRKLQEYERLQSELKALSLELELDHPEVVLLHKNDTSPEADNEAQIKAKIEN